MDFGIITNLNSYVKSTLSNPLNKMKKEQSNPIFQQLNTEPEGGSDDRLSAIILKMQSGEELTAGELEYLKEHSPDAYNAAIKAAREKQAYENELRRCKTKDEVRLLHMAKISPLFNKANDAKARNDLTTAQAALAEASVLTDIFTKFTATRDYAKKAPDRAALEKAIQTEKDKYVKEDKNMSITPINKIPSYYATHNVNKQNETDETDKAYDVSISVDKALRNHYSNLLSKYSNQEGNKFELMKDGYSKLLGEINQKYAGNQDELDGNIRALDVAFKSSVSIHAAMRGVILSHNSETVSEGLQLQRKISELPGFDKDTFTGNTASTLSKFADKFIEFTKSGSVDNAWNKAISYFDGIETTSVNTLSLNDIFSLFSYDQTELSPFMRNVLK